MLMSFKFVSKDFSQNFTQLKASFRLLLPGLPSFLCSLGLL